jgi:hypothetical protein
MIIVKVWGGIGNQLFQYVFGQYLHYRYNVEVMYDDNSYVSNDKLRKSELCALDANIIFDNQCSFSRYRGLKNRWMRLWFQLNPMKHYVCEGNRIPERFKKNHIYFFQGYWQNELYYSWLKQNCPSFDLVSRNMPQELMVVKDKIISTPDSVSVHVRRGDYFAPQNIKKYGVCDVNYFNRSIELFKERLKNPVYFVFSDDLDWVSNNISLPPNTILVPNYEVDQFLYIELMSLCHHHIISNSSFSWWGAVLNEHADDFVVSPKRWLLTTEKTIALNKWTKI